MSGILQAMLMSSGAQVGGALSVNITPLNGTSSLPNGGAYSKTFTANASGGATPYSYSWSIAGGTFSSSGGTTNPTFTVTHAAMINNEANGIVTVTVTEAGGVTANDALSIDVIWGTPP